MVDQPRPPAQPGAWWGTIRSSASQHLTTAEVWDAIHEQAASQGLTEPPGMFAYVDRARGIAGAQQRAMERLAATDPSAALTSEHMAAAVYARPASELGPLGPIYHARVEMTMLTREGTETQIYTLEYTIENLPSTVSELRADAELVGESLVEAYGATFGGVGQIELTWY